MGKIKQISNSEVLESIYNGIPVYMLIKCNEETTFAEAIDADAFVIIGENNNEEAEDTTGSDVYDELHAHIGDEDSERERQGVNDNKAGTEEDGKSFEEIENALPPDNPEKYPAKKKKKGKGTSAAQRTNGVDHGKIIACYRAGRSISWIADEVGYTYQTVVNHLNKEGIYKK